MIYYDKTFQVVRVEGITIPDIWFRILRAILIYGEEAPVDTGSYATVHYRIQLPYFLGVITTPSWGSGTEEILPQFPPWFSSPRPFDTNYLYNSYIHQLLTSIKQPNEEYTYGERIESQIDKIISGFKKGLNTNQMIIQVAGPEDIDLKDPPCLRHIDIKIRDYKLWFYIYFRSWDAWNGLPVNLAGIEYLQKLISQEIGIEQGPFIIESKGLHIYNYVLDSVKELLLCQRQ